MKITDWRFWSGYLWGLIFGTLMGHFTGALTWNLPTVVVYVLTLFACLVAVVGYAWWRGSLTD